MRHQRGQLLQPLIAWRLGIDLTDFREQPLCRRLPPRRLVAAMDIQRTLGVDRGQTEGFIPYKLVL